MPDVESTTRAKVLDAALSEPIAVEQLGVFSRLYSAWRAESDDPAATEDAERFFDTAFTTLGIRPESEYIRCGDVHCRARFRFNDLKELYRMTEIGEADGVKVATTFPQEDEGYQTVSIYWTRAPNPQTSLLNPPLPDAGHE
jgi:hypothetical protein